jgi:ABC-type branched-subunit amino acid transport system ATPase component
MLELRVDVFRDRVPVVRGAALTLAGGEAAGVVGRNGAGKTSLLAGIMGLLPTTGEIRVSGIDVARWPAHRRALHGLAIVPQGRRLFAELTVAENLRTAEVSPPSTGPRFDPFELFPKLRTLLARRAGVLSGGEQQQVAIARALLRRPRILLLDEPTEGLAPAIVDTVVDALGRLKHGGLTLLIAEQRLDVVAELCDAVALIRAGELAAHGAPSSPDIREQLLAL